jgi:hypothetical protein
MACSASTRGLVPDFSPGRGAWISKRRNASKSLIDRNSSRRQKTWGSLLRGKHSRTMNRTGSEGKDARGRSRRDRRHGDRPWRTVSLPTAHVSPSLRTRGSLFLPSMTVRLEARRPGSLLMKNGYFRPIASGRMPGSRCVKEIVMSRVLLWPDPAVLAESGHIREWITATIDLDSCKRVAPRYEKSLSEMDIRNRKLPPGMNVTSSSPLFAPALAQPAASRRRHG